jgi:molybdopterin-guanine dinucleotide biosynthesis protein A
MQNPGVCSTRPVGVILAGGRSRRMNGKVKSLLDLAGKPLLKHVIDRVDSQVSCLTLSVEQPSDVLAQFGLALVCDPRRDAGPLVGLLTALQEMEASNDWLLLVPCDAPFLPRDLAARLLARALETRLPGAVVRYESEIQPTFSIWNRELLPLLEHNVMVRKMQGFKQFLQQTELAVLDWPAAEPSPFFNINKPADLIEAGRLLVPGSGVATSCSA